MKKKKVVVEIETDLNNNDLKNVVRTYLERGIAGIKVSQIQVNLVKSEKK